MAAMNDCPNSCRFLIDMGEDMSAIDDSIYTL